MRRKTAKFTSILAAAAITLSMVIPVTAVAAPTNIDVTGIGNQQQAALNQVNGLPPDAGFTVDPDTAGTGKASISVLAATTDAANIFYDLDISYGTMMFTYDYGAVWDPATHKYTTPAGGSVSGGWRLSDLDEVNNKITVANNSNFPMMAEFSYTPNDSLNDDNTKATSVTGIFCETNATIKRADFLNAGKDDNLIKNYVSTNDRKPTLILEMNLQELDSGTWKYCYQGTTAAAQNSGGQKHTKDMFFALSGIPDLDKSHSTASEAGTITVDISPCQGVTYNTVTIP